MRKSGPPPDSEDASKVQARSEGTQQSGAIGYSPQTASPSQLIKPNYLPQQASQYGYNQQPVQYAVSTGAPHQAHLTITSIKSVEKSIIDTYILCIVLGLAGAHHLYLRRPLFFVAYFFTFGLFGVGWLVDIFRVPCLVKEANARIRDASREKTRYKFDAYLLWFPFGILGFHLFYLNRPGQGLLYFFTFGLCGLGWLVDLVRIPYMVKDCNYEGPRVYQEKSMFATYVLCVSPFGILGAHHYYLNRPYWGVLYTFTFGLMGVGWLVDVCRCYRLVSRTREEELGHIDKGLTYYDDIYLLWFPLGWLGLHHFYLRRYVWGFLYFFTFGLMGIGWLIDFCRLPCMIKDHNKQLLDNRQLSKSAQQQLNGHLNSRAEGDRLVTTTVSTAVVSPQHIGYYGSTAPQGAIGGPYFTPGMVYPQYPNIYINNQTGYQNGQFQRQPLQTPSILNQAGVMYPPTYEEATTENITVKE